MDNGYPIGIGKSDMFFSLGTVCIMASNLKANIFFQDMKQGFKGKIAEICVQEN